MKKHIEPKNKTMYGCRIANILNSKECPFTQATLADKVLISTGAMSNIINGVNTPSIDIIERLANALNVSVDYLIGKTNNPTTNRDLDIIYDYTGLSKKAVGLLHTCNKDLSAIFNNVIENLNFWALIGQIGKYREFSKDAYPVELWLNKGEYAKMRDNSSMKSIKERDLCLFQIQELIKDIAKEGANNASIQK